MLMLPVTFLPATGLVLLAIWLATRLANDLRALWLVGLLFCLAVQLLLLGTRFGYGVESILSIQHLTGVLIPPLGYLAFKNPRLSLRTAFHLLPIVVIGCVILFAVHVVDAVLALITFAYAGGLLIALLQDKDELFSWAPFRFSPALRFGLWATLATLLVSGATDAVIAADFLTTGGARISGIVASASLVSLALLAVGLILLLRRGVSQKPTSTSPSDQALIQKLSNEIVKKELFRDPDLTLSRLSKRLALPTREISQAVNRGTNLNVSQFVNNMRIAAACDMLTTSDASITRAMLEAGFYTKSNFNREFRRVTGQSPTEWRAAAHSKELDFRNK